MPELAEVFYYAHQWDEGIGQTILSVEAHQKSRVFRECDVAALRRGLVGARLKRTHTHGKRMLFEFSGGRWLRIHLGMTGELSANSASYSQTKHDHLVCHTKRIALVFHDPRQFGSVMYYKGKSLPAFWRSLPPQPMDRSFTSHLLTGVLRRHARQPLKALLLDQRYFPGIGNWMADEILWQSKLPPHVLAGSLSAKKGGELWRALRKICSVALKTVGSDWSDPPKTWLFRHRWKRGSICPHCGAKLRHETLRGRTACWCPVCQKAGGARGS